MTVDMLAATFFWPEGTLLHVRDDVLQDTDNEAMGSAALPADPWLEPHAETFWTTMLRQIGWPLPPKLPRLS